MNSQIAPPGSHNPAPSMQGEDRARTKVEEAIQALPPASSHAYRQAKAATPELVAKETDPIMFVRRCDGDIRAAASRLCLYWKERLALFGDRAFRPLDLSGHGALTQNEILSVQAGFPAILPDARNGQKVLLCDRRKAISATSTPEGRWRCAFYAQNILAQSDTRTQTEGILVLVVLITPRFPPLDQVMSNRLMENAAKIFPTKAHVHFLTLPPIPKAGKTLLVQDITKKTMAAAAATKGFASIHLHVERESAGLVHKLTKDVGLLKSGIPLGFGGSWKLEEFFKWCKDREATDLREYERKSLATGAEVKPDHKPASQKNTNLTEEEKLQKRRLADVMHSRRKRERKKKQVEILEKEHNEAKSEHEALQAENARLEALLNQAKALVGQPTPPQSVPASQGAPTTSSSSLNTEGPRNNSAAVGQLLAQAKTLFAARTAQQVLQTPQQTGLWPSSAPIVPPRPSPTAAPQVQQPPQMDWATLKALSERSNSVQLEGLLKQLHAQTTAPASMPQISTAAPVPLSSANGWLQQHTPVAPPAPQNGTAGPAHVSVYAIASLLQGIANLRSCGNPILVAPGASSGSNRLHEVVSAVANLPPDARGEVLAYLIQQALAEGRM